MAVYASDDTSGENYTADHQQAMAERDQELAERRHWEAQHEDPSTPLPSRIGSRDLQSALGHWADTDEFGYSATHGDAYFEKHQTDAGFADSVPQVLAANEIHNHYMVQSEADFDKIGERAQPEDTELDLSSPDRRVKALDNMVQNQAGDRSAEDRCAAVSMVGGAMLAGGKQGTEGLTTLMNAMDGYAKTPEDRKKLDEAMRGMREKIAAGDKLTAGDMHGLEAQLYQELDASEVGRKDKDGKDMSNLPGIESDTMQKFIHSNPQLAKMMKDNNMAVSFIKHDPTSPNAGHAVLSIGGDHGAVYDPEMRDDGQIVTDKDELARYKTAEAERAQ